MEDEGGPEGGFQVLGASASRAALEEAYELGRELSSGASGTVVAARRRDAPEGAREVVVKLVSKRVASADPRWAERLRAEVAAMVRLRGVPHVAQLVSAHEDAGRVALVVERCDEGELHDAIPHAGYGEGDARQVLAGVLRAVAACHAAGVAHRDICPANVLLHRGEAVLVDFGLSAEGAKMEGGVGNPHYVAPEALTGKPYGPEADLYSVGALLHMLLAGVPPFWNELWLGAHAAHGAELPASAQLDVFRQMRRTEINLHAPPWPGRSREAVSLLLGLLERSPSKRLSARDALAHPWMSTRSVGPATPPRALLQRTETPESPVAVTLANAFDPNLNGAARFFQQWRTGWFERNLVSNDLQRRHARELEILREEHARQVAELRRGYERELESERARVRDLEERYGELMRQHAELADNLLGGRPLDDDIAAPDGREIW